MLYVLGEAALRTALLTGILQCMLLLLRVRQTRLLLAAWTIVLVISLIMPLLLRSSPVRIPLNDALPRALFDSATELMQQPLMQEPAGTASIETQVQSSIKAWLEIAYILIASCLGLRTLFGVGLSLRILARARPTCPEWALGLRVRLSREVAGPVTIARTIVLPTDFDQWPTEMRQAVMAHEHAHVARRDYAMLVVSQLNRAVFWFSPIPWWLHRRLVVLAELVSDDQAIEVMRDRVGYAEILIEMAQRSGRRTQGPSMASFATLPLRIDRILFDQVTSNQVSRLRWATVTLGVAAVSLMVANLAPLVVPIPVAPDPSDPSIREARVENPPQEVSSGTLLSTDRAFEPNVSYSPTPSIVAPSVVPTVQIRPAVRPRNAVQAATKSILTPLIAKRAQGKMLSLDDERSGTSRGLEVADQGKIGSDTGNTRNIVAPQMPSGIERVQTSLPREITNDPVLSEIDRLNGSTCVGTVAVGMGAYYQGGGLLEPNVKAGQVLPAKAQFFRKADGSLWVRFGSFERPPLDVKVQPTRTGVTWTGEYGIAYAVQHSGDNHLVGLAARIANDSAVLNFICRK